MTINTTLTSLLTLTAILLANRAEAVEFDTRLLAGTSQEADLSRFYRQSDLPAGQHTFDIYVNGNWKGRFPLQLGEQPEQIAMRYEDAAVLGIDLTALPKQQKATQLLPLNALVQGGSITQETDTLSMKLSVPQAHIIHAENGYVDPQFWQQGESALLFSYNTTYYRSQFKTGNTATRDDLYAGLNSGFNLEGWQFRDNSTFSHYSGRDSQWRNNTRYLQRGFSSITSTLTGGDFYSPGNMFDSIRLRGISLASDTNMLP
ncbi:MAG: FimD/PapC N-terminal domain-containing protein, partial [Serratia inhibens]|uniref:FimD/PapC N-terminal domain-containing protein n=1 Tax=Serratia inhibens TaxID=2338073 RepID=UPI003C7B4832